MHIVPSTAPILTKPFLTQVKRCEDALHRISNLQTLLHERNIYHPLSEFPPEAYTELYTLWSRQYERSQAHPTTILNDVITEVQTAWTYHQDLTKRAEILSTKMQSLRDNIALIRAG